LDSTKYIYILLSDTGTLFTKSIKKYTKAPYNHASLAFDRELNEVYSFGRKNPKNPLNGGFVREDILHGTYRHYPDTTCAIYELQVTEREIQKLRRMVSVFEKNKSKFTYNLLGLMGIPINEPIEFNASYFCSQFVFEILKRSGINLGNKLPALITPDDIRNSNKLNLIYEGKLFSYEPIKRKVL
jgi:hypothetical protein